MTVRKVWVANRFGGGPPRSENGDISEPTFTSDLNAVRDAFQRFGLLDDRVAFLQGDLAERLEAAPIGRVALLRIDGRTADEIGAALEILYERVVPGGFIVIDDYWKPDCQEVVDRFRAERGIVDPIQRVDWSGAAWRKTERVEADDDAAGPGPAPQGKGLLPATKDLSVVVVVHNMRREAARTLYSLSSRYQQGLGELDYEVIVVENGSDPEQALGEGYVRGFGPEFTLRRPRRGVGSLAGEGAQPRHARISRARDRADDRRRPRAHPRGPAVGDARA